MKTIASPLFAGFTPADWDALSRAGQLRTRRFARHEVIFHAGSRVREMGVVLQGTVHIENLDLWGSKSILSSVPSGQVFAETYAFCGDTLMVDAVAAEDCEVLFVHVAAFSGEVSGKLLHNLLAVSMRKNLKIGRASCRERVYVLV